MTDSTPSRDGAGDPGAAGAEPRARRGPEADARRDEADGRAGEESATATLASYSGGQL